MKKQAFTLVELIVVVTILAILATIGFVSYSGYLSGVRDTNRIASLTSISDGLELYRTKNSLPDPDDAIDIQIEGVDIAHQGYVGSNVLQTIEYSKAGKDPKDDSYYSYYLTDDKKHYQLMAFLEEADNLDSNFSFQSYAAISYTNRVPKVYGKKLGILIDGDKNPIQEVVTGNLDITSTSTEIYTAIFSDGESITASGNTLKTIAVDSSCKRMKALKGGSKNGVYSINPFGSGSTAYQVYCDMTTDGGGWTYATMLAEANSSTINLFETSNSNKITSLSKNIGTKGQLSNMWQDSLNKDILLVCRTNHDALKSYEEPTIIYGYLKDDIGELTKNTKKGTLFSSIELGAKYNNKKFFLNKDYANGGTDTSIYIKEAAGKNIVYMHTQLGVTASGYENSASYNADGSTYEPLSVNNYCMTAIR